MTQENGWIGALAVERGMLARERLDACLRALNGHLRDRPLGQVLLDRGLLTQEQRVDLIDEHLRRIDPSTDYARIREEDSLFCSLLVHHGFATEGQVEAARARQQDLAEEGTIRRVGELLGKSLGVSPETYQKTVIRESRSGMVCPGCAAPFATESSINGKVYECTKCGMKLEVATAPTAIQGEPAGSARPGRRRASGNTCWCARSGRAGSAR